MENQLDNHKEQKKNTKKLKTRMLLVVVFAIVLLGFTYLSYRASYLEAYEIGENFKEAFTTNLKYQYAISLANFLVLFSILYITNRGIKKGLQVFFEEEKKDIPKLPNKSIAFIGAAIISILISKWMISRTVLFFNMAWFGMNDPIFNMDIGFYTFQKPFIEMLIFYAIGILIGLMIYTAIYYIVAFNKYFDGVNAQTLKNSKLLKQLYQYLLGISIGLAALILVKTQGMLTDKFIILGDEVSTAIYGAGITEVTIKLWGYRILAIVVVLSVYFAIYYFKQKKTKRTLLAILTVPAYLVALFMLMIGFKLLYINRNELDKEKKYLSYNIENTKVAYGIKIEETELNIGNSNGLEEIENQMELVQQSTIVNEEITLKSLNVTQTNTGYYSYRNANINLYTIHGRPEVVHIAPREIVSNGNRTYNNKTYEYTHGYGVVATSASHTESTGTVEYLQKDFQNGNQAISITQPRIYFGLETNNTIVTNTKNKSEFDYPTSNSQNAEFSYDGTAGLKLNFFDRLLVAMKQGDINLAFSSNLTKESKILMNRNIINRAKAVMPYLIYDSNPYLVISEEGKLVWVLDAYTVTDKYPYSQPITIEHENMKQQINYIRNSVKVLIDAYDGTMQFYITDKSDPIIMAYRNAYPTLFMELEETIPKDIVEHFVYPEFLYNIQATILERYHNVSTDVLYRSDDVWETAKYSKTSTVSNKGIKQDPYYTMVKTVGSENMYLGLVLPYTPLNKQNLRAYLIGSYESGEPSLKLYQFPTDSNILGPMQLDRLLNQDETIAKELDTLNVTGMKTMKNIIMVPINNTILYIEPIFQVSLNEAQSVPVLKKVIVSSENKVAIADNLKDAIKNLLSQSAVDIKVENTDTVEELVNAIIKANENLEKSNASNDWEMIGKDMKRLQELIKKLQLLTQEIEQKDKNTLDSNTIGNELTNEMVNSVGNILEY